MAAIEYLCTNATTAPMYSFSWINIGEPGAQAGVDFDGFDVIMVKSNWEWGLDRAARATLGKVRGLLEPPRWRASAGCGSTSAATVIKFVLYTPDGPCMVRESAACTLLLCVGAVAGKGEAYSVDIGCASAA